MLRWSAAMLRACLRMYSSFTLRPNCCQRSSYQLGLRCEMMNPPNPLVFPSIWWPLLESWVTPAPSSKICRNTIFLLLRITTNPHDNSEIDNHYYKESTFGVTKGSTWLISFDLQTTGSFSTRACRSWIVPHGGDAGRSASPFHSSVMLVLPGLLSRYIVTLWILINCDQVLLILLLDTCHDRWLSSYINCGNGQDD